MIFKLRTMPEGYEQAAEELLQERGYRLCAPGEWEKTEKESVVELSVNLNPEKKISVVYTAGSGKETGGSASAAGNAVITAGGRAFAFRGLMRLVRELEKRGRKESFRVEEEVWLDRNGVMLDCSRNSALTVDTIKWYIRFEASLGMNTMMLYTEDT